MQQQQEGLSLLFPFLAAASQQLQVPAAAAGVVSAQAGPSTPVHKKLASLLPL